MTEDLYFALGLDGDATVAEIRAAYRKLAKTCHPDVGGDPETFRLIQLAEAVLTDDVRRAAYDATGAVDERPTAEQMKSDAIATLGSALEMALEVPDNPLNNSADLIATMRMLLTQKREEIKKDQGKFEKRVARLTKVKKRMSVKEGENHLASILQSGIDQAQATLRKIPLVLEILDLAFVELERYVYQPEAFNASLYMPIRRDSAFSIFNSNVF